MTIREAIQKGAQAVRLPEWAAETYLSFYRGVDGHLGPWVTLHDPNAGEDQKILLLELVNDPSDRYVVAASPTPRE